jgi:hypothetical protein
MSFGAGGAIISCFLLVTELSDSGYRGYYAMVMWMHWGFSYILVNLSLLIMTSWRGIYLMLFIVSMVLLGLSWLVHESPRALTASMGRFHVARMILRKIATVNKVMSNPRLSLPKTTKTPSTPYEGAFPTSPQLLGLCLSQNQDS